MPAIGVRVLDAYAFANGDGTLRFFPLLSSKYESSGGQTIDAKSPFDFEAKLPRGRKVRTGCVIDFDDAKSLNELRYYVVFIQFKVPYSKRKDFETEVYRIVKKPDDRSFLWQPLEKSEAANILEDFAQFVRSSPTIEVLDYKNEEGKAIDPPSFVILRELSKRITAVKDFLKDF